MRDLIGEVLTSVYQASPGLNLWRWSADGRALEWPDGSTIVFRAELVEVLARLAPQGLPSLTSLLLLCAACRDGWRESSRQALADLLDDPRVASERGSRQLRVVLSQAFAGLDRIAQLPAELRLGVDAKAAICGALVDGLPEQLDAREAAWVVDAMAWVGPAQSHELGSGYAPLLALLPDLRALRAALDRYDRPGLEARVRSGVAEALRPAPVELPPGERVRRLLSDLREDPELGGISRLTTDLLAAVHVPRPLLDRDEQPLGGVADVSNRGPLHRLLVSELAHDDLTFMVRVATGEALYLRREPPPRRPPIARRVLIDCGIRLWGTPRVFATAVALALMADAGAGAEAETFRACRGEPVPAPLLTRGELLEQLEQLEPDPEPSLALGALAASAGSAGVDVILITHRDTVADPALRRRLRELSAQQTVYVASVDAEGRYELWRYAARGRKRVARAQLELERLLERRASAPAGEALSLQPVERDQPRLLSVQPFPLLLPCPLRAERACAHPVHGVLATSPDRRLMHWERPDRGARELTPSLPPGLTRWIEIDEEGVGRCLRDGVRAPALVVADLARGLVGRLTLAGPPRPQAAFRLGSALALLYPRHVTLFSLATGKRLCAMRLPSGCKHLCGRVFRAEDGALSAASWDGSGVTLRELPARDLHPRVLWAWERGDGIWALLENGWAQPLGSAEGGFSAVEASSLLAHARIQASRDGQRLLLLDTRPRVSVSQDEADQRRILVDLEARSWRRALGEPLALEPDLVPFAQSPTLRKRVEALAVDPDGRLALVTRNQRVLSLAMDPFAQSLGWAVGAAGAGRHSRLRGFAPIDPPPGRGYSLRMASWGDGSRAYLDGRGLLHLQSSRRSDPEIAVVLAERGPMAVWVSGEAGGVAGDPYFLGAPPTLSMTAAFRHVQRFVEQLP